MYIINDSTGNDELFPRHKGRGLDLSSRPRGFAYGGTAEPFPDSMLIPKSEWQSRIQEMEQRKSRLSDLCRDAGLKCKDQQQTNYCATEDTEVLTDRGWVAWPDYNGTDLLGTMSVGTGMLEFQAPTATHVYEHDGPMVYSSHASLDFGVTPDHRMLVRKWDESRRKLSDQWTFQRAGDLGWYFALPHAPSGFVGTGFRRIEIEGDRTYDGDDFIALTALVVSDGYAGGTEKTRNWVSFACFRKDRLLAVRGLAARLGFTEKRTTPGVFIRYDAGALAVWFRSNAYTSSDLRAQNKRVPDFIKSASSDQIAHFLKMYGDQSHDRGNHYFSTSKRAVDDLQELFLRIGKRGSIWEEERDGKTGQLADGGQIITSRRKMYHLHVRRMDRLSVDRKANLFTERYKGPVYCATVPNSTLVTRRNDSVLISGNCWVNAPTYCVEVLRTLENERPVVLSPASVGAQITGYWNVGGWGKSALEWITAHGIVPADKWPPNAISRQYATDDNIKTAMDYRVDEWWEIPPGEIEPLVSALLRGFPVAVGLSWWSHEVSYIDPVWLDGDIAIRFRNSWGMGYGTEGYNILQGRKILPDDAVCPRTTKAS